MKQTTLFFLFLLHCLLAGAQQRFIKTVSANGYGSLLKVLPAGNKGWVVFSRDSLNMTRFDQCGFPIWSKKYNLSNTFPVLSDFITAKNGGYTILCRVNTSTVESSVVTRIDSSGNVSWCRRIDNPDYRQFPYTLSEDAQGNVYVYANIEHVSLWPINNMICKIDPNGNLLRTNYYDHGWVWGGAICTSDGGMLIRSGSTFIKTDQNGNVQWASLFGFLTYHYFRALEVSDGYIFTGYNTNAAQNICLYKMDKQGKELWGSRKQTNLTGIPSAMEKLSNGNFTLRFNPNKIIEFDKDGNIISEGWPDLSSQGISLLSRDICHLSDNTPVITGLTGVADEFFIAKMNTAYQTGCDNVSSTTVTWEPDTQRFDPIVMSTANLNLVNWNYTVDTFTVSVITVCNVSKVLDLGPDTSLCQGSVMVLQNITGDQFDHYHWSTGETASSITVSMAGTYWLYAYDNCQENQRNDTVWIHILPIVAANLGDDLFKCENESLYLFAPDCDSCTFTWSTGSFADSIEAETEGAYWLRVDNNNGCITGDTVEVEEVKCECFLYAPNAFTPNNDGVNELFRTVYDCDIFDFNLKIFNRWGQLVFESDDINTGWDGSFKGVSSPGGIYVYLVSYRPLIKGVLQSQTLKPGTVAVIY